jgi:outer membrane protein assembly factor BamE (lipoprotein component of BamABCDE complex)
VASVWLIFAVSRPPRVWDGFKAGMSRHEVYKRLGQPYFSAEEKGFVFWQKNLLVCKWELSVAFHDDDTVGAFGRDWRWNYW